MAQNGEQLTITAEKLTREDTIVVTEQGAFIEKGLVLHGANPGVTVGDMLVTVAGEQFSSMEDLTQLLYRAGSTGTPFQLQILRQKEEETSNVIERVVVELNKTQEDIGLTVATEGDFVVVAKAEGLSQDAGIRQGDAIMYLNGERVFAPADVTRLSENQTKLLFKLKRGKLSSNKVEFEEKSMLIKVPFSSGDLLGVTLNKDLVVTKIQPGSLADEKFEINDRIVDINGMKFKDENRLFKFLARCDDDLTIEVMRAVPKDPDAGKNATQNNLVLMYLQMNPYEPIGIRPDEKLMISTIQQNSHGEGKFELGDIIKYVNGHAIHDRNHFFKQMEAATSKGRVEVIVERSASREAELEMCQLPPNIEKIVKRHAGYQYLMVNIKYVPKAGRVFGLNIANVTSHKIIVPEIAENCVAGDYLKPLDHIIAINGVPVSDTTIAKKLIRDCRACFQAVIERPVTIDALAAVRKEVEEWRKKANKPPPTKNMEEMPLDVQEIVMNLLRRREKGENQTPAMPSPMRAVTATRPRLTFGEKHTETQIQSDVPASKTLRSLK
uniref:PDZ domain-containing protein n=1 Tax=Panagrellus redivivus TaxID=6233 RepID=A0A7E4VQ65_PANRE